jgi:serine/threonine protein kinase
LLLECEIMAQKLHPSLMPLIEHVALPNTQGEGGTVYMLMPLCKNGSLWDYVHKRFEQQHPLSGGEMLSILAQVCSIRCLHC